MIKEEAIEILSDMRAEYNIFSDDEEEATRYHALSWAIQALNERTGWKKGKWLKHGGMIYCSNCANSFEKYFVDDFIYCPNCGADLRGEQNDSV